MYYINFHLLYLINTTSRVYNFLGNLFSVPLQTEVHKINNNAVNGPTDIISNKFSNEG